MGLGLSLRIGHSCYVCQEHLEGTDAILFIGNKKYRVNMEKWLNLIIMTREGKKFDSLKFCPSCFGSGHDHKDRNYRNRARRFISRHMPDKVIK